MEHFAPTLMSALLFLENLNQDIHAQQTPTVQTQPEASCAHVWQGLLEMDSRVKVSSILL